jgi:hypothetical protein
VNALPKRYGPIPKAARTHRNKVGGRGSVPMPLWLHRRLEIRIAVNCYFSATC